MQIFDGKHAVTLCNGKMLAGHPVILNGNIAVPRTPYNNAPCNIHRKLPPCALHPFQAKLDLPPWDLFFLYLHMVFSLYIGLEHRPSLNGDNPFLLLYPVP